MIAEVTDDRDLRRIHDEILSPAFPAAELVPVESILRGVARGTTSVVASRTDAGEVAAVAVGDHDADAGITLLSYLAAAPGGRGRGAGGDVLAAALTRWRRRWDPELIVAEIEDPSSHTASVEHGDPARRVRFYERGGALALDLPYYQPSLAPGSPRVPGMILIAWPGTSPVEAGTRVEGAALSRFLRAYTDDAYTEDGGGADDPQRAALLAAASEPAGVRVLALGEAIRRS